MTPPLVRPERQRVADDHPLDADERDDDEALHDRRQDVLLAGEPAVEEAQPRRHEEHQGGSRQDPRGIPRG